MFAGNGRYMLDWKQLDDRIAVSARGMRFKLDVEVD
jgi:hypothetical protein